MDGFPCPRYLTRFSTRELPLRWADVLVLGSGVAGLSAALRAAEKSTVIVVTKSEVQESNTFYAQGGVAAVLDTEADSYALHAQDTLIAGAGLCDEAIVNLVVEEGAECVQELIEKGAEFDRDDDGELSMTREGGHSASRILHATGDATGKEISRTLVQRARAHPRIRFLEHAFAVDLVTSHGECQGALVWDDGQGMQFVAARATILASGGAGRVFRETTNPRVATGDGLAMAYRAGAELLDMEFMQFHPTTLYVAGAARVLLSEALRGEGAHLKDADGARFMVGLHERAELGPRDVVARAIVRRLRETNGRGVSLDLTHLDAEHLRKRFPGIDRTCRSYGLDFTKDPLPVHPSAHYTIGGVKIDENGQTSLPGLFAIGEVSCSGLHGANRLASNSLLEGLVHGRRAGLLAAERASASLGGVAHMALEAGGDSPHSFQRAEIDISDVLAAMRSNVWRGLGIERTAEGMQQLAAKLDFWAGYVLPHNFAGPRGWELQNQLTVAALMTRAARWREESRGAHHRLDYPEPSEAFLEHSSLQRPQEVTK